MCGIHTHTHTHTHIPKTKLSKSDDYLSIIKIFIQRLLQSLALNNND